ncbi:ead/Ea22-like family protein [Klebsiella aerogenes]
MTNNQLTDERVTSVIERLEHFASNLKWTDASGAQDLLTAADGLRELQERRKVNSDLTMWVKRLGYSLKRAKPDSKLPGEAMAYLSAKVLISVEDILR